MLETRCPFRDCAAPFTIDSRSMGQGTVCPRCDRAMTARPLALYARLERRERYVRDGQPRAAAPASEERIEGQRRYFYHAAGAAAVDGEVSGRDPMYEASVDRPERLLPTVGLTAVLDDIRSRWNVGAIFRTAEAAGWERLVLCGITAVPPAAMIRKTALGAEQMVPWQYHSSVIEGLRALADQGTELWALELTDDAEDLFSLTVPRRATLVLGNEVGGVSREALALCRRRVAIPMTGRKGSLNVAVAFGVAAFTLAGRWRAQYDGSDAGAGAPALA